MAFLDLSGLSHFLDKLKTVFATEEDLDTKADIVDNPTSGNFVSLDANGNIADSGHKHSDYLTSHQDISGKADKADTVLDTTLSRGRFAYSTVGTGSFAFGYEVTASGAYSHGEGRYTIAYGDGSHAQGYETIANDASMTALGKYNIPSKPDTVTTAWNSTSVYKMGTCVNYNNVIYCALANSLNEEPDTHPSIWHAIGSDYKTVAEAVGWGSSNTARKNIRALDRDGNEYLKGSLFVGCNDDSTGGTEVVSKSSILNLVYPVGSIYMSANATSPATLFGGTWEAINGKFLLACDTSHVAGSTGGDASVKYTPSGTVANHTLTTAQIPSHNHTFTGTAVTSTENSVGHTHTYRDYYATTTGTHTITEAELASHTHGQYVTKTESGGSASRADFTSVAASKAYEQGQATKSKGSGTAHSHSGANTYTDRTSNGVSANHKHNVTASGTIGNTGSGNAHNHGFTGTEATIATMPPYLAVYMWKRTA